MSSKKKKSRCLLRLSATATSHTSLPLQKTVNCLLRQRCHHLFRCSLRPLQRGAPVLVAGPSVTALIQRHRSVSATRKKKKNYFPSSFFNAHFIRAQRHASGAPPTGSNSSTASAALPTAQHQSHSQRASFLCTQSKQLLHHRAAEPSAGSACYLRLRTAGSSAVLLRFRVSIDFSASSSTPHKTQRTAAQGHHTAQKQQHSSSSTQAARTSEIVHPRNTAVQLARTAEAPRPACSADSVHHHMCTHNTHTHTTCAARSTISHHRLDTAPLQSRRHPARRVQHTHIHTHAHTQNIITGIRCSIVLLASHLIMKDR